MAKKKIRRAGFIPYYIEQGEIYFLLMKPSDNKYGGDKFQIAKGKIEDNGETSFEAAIREASEELGLKESNVMRSKYLGTFLGYTEIFFGKIRDKDDFTGTTYETGETTWMNLDEFIKNGRTIHIPIIRSFIRAATKVEALVESFLQNHVSAK